MKELNNNFGQSLIEIVAAIAVISIGILAIVKVTTKSISNTTFARNRALATKYAQDTVEKIREYRDRNNWETFKADCNDETKLGLTVVPTPFTREPIACSGSDDNSRNIVVIISWSDAAGNHESRIQTDLTSWK